MSEAALQVLYLKMLFEKYCSSKPGVMREEHVMILPVLETTEYINHMNIIADLHFLMVTDSVPQHGDLCKHGFKKTMNRVDI